MANRLLSKSGAFSGTYLPPYPNISNKNPPNKNKSDPSSQKTTMKGNVWWGSVVPQALVKVRWRAMRWTTFRIGGTWREAVCMCSVRGSRWWRGCVRGWSGRCRRIGVAGWRYLRSRIRFILLIRILRLRNWLLLWIELMRISSSFWIMLTSFHPKNWATGVTGS